RTMARLCRWPWSSRPARERHSCFITRSCGDRGLKLSPESQGEAARRVEGGSGKHTGKVDQVETICKIERVRLKSKLQFVGVDQRGRTVSQKQPACDRKLSKADHVAIAHLSAELSKPADVDLALEPSNGRLAECDWKTDSGIYQQAVVAEVFKAAPVPASIQA